MSSRPDASPRQRALGSARIRHGNRDVHHPLVSAAVVGLAAVTGFALVYTQTLAYQYESTVNVRDNASLIEKLPSQEEAPPADGAEGRALNILLMGSDQRDGDNGRIGGSVEGMRNDTTIVMHISADRNRVDFVSIPRDTIVAVPDCTLHDGTVVKGWTGKFNIAFANGGRQGDAGEAAACVQNTVQQLFQVPIDHYVVVDFTGFIKMIDAVGGVPMCIPERIVSSKAKLDLQPGAQLLDGKTALAFARLRTAEQGDVSGSDLQRIDRQQELMLQTARIAMSKNLLTDTGELTQFLKAIAESLTVDPALGSSGYMMGLAFSLRNLDTKNITFTTIPWEYERPAYDVIIRPEATQMWDDLINDRPLSVLGDKDEWDNGREGASVPDESAEPPTGATAPTTPSTPSAPTETPERESVDEILAECTV